MENTTSDNEWETMTSLTIFHCGFWYTFPFPSIAIGSTSSTTIDSTWVIADGLFHCHSFDCYFSYLIDPDWFRWKYFHLPYSPSYWSYFVSFQIVCYSTAYSNTFLFPVYTYWLIYLMYWWCYWNSYENEAYSNRHYYLLYPFNWCYSTNE